MGGGCCWANKVFWFSFLNRSNSFLIDSLRSEVLNQVLPAFAMGGILFFKRVLVLLLLSAQLLFNHWTELYETDTMCKFADSQKIPVFLFICYWYAILNRERWPILSILLEKFISTSPMNSLNMISLIF